MEPQNVGPFQFEPHQIVDDEFMEWLQQKRRTPQRRSVQPLALLMANRFFNDLDAKFRVLKIQFIVWII